ncbi:MAG: hypothetical protein ACJ8FV_23150 [Xanthobacteraceae bacterium]
MRILFDQGTPAPLRRALTGHIVSTAYEMSWTKLDNGAVLDAAELHFDVFDYDPNLRYQQNVSGRKLAIMVLPTTSWPKIKEHLSHIISAVDGLRSGDFVELNFSEQDS